LLAAVEHGGNSIAVEIDPFYCDVVYPPACHELYEKGGEKDRMNRMNTRDHFQQPIL
jgi:hypothetical protein